MERSRTQITGTVEQGSVISDDDPAGDIASGGTTFMMTGKNIGDLLNDKNVTWGWFEGGFDNPSQSHIGANGNSENGLHPASSTFSILPVDREPEPQPSDVGRADWSSGSASKRRQSSV